MLITIRVINIVIDTPVILDITADKVFLFFPDTKIKHILENIIVPINDSNGNDISLTFRYTIVLNSTILSIKLIIDRKPFSLPTNTIIRMNDTISITMYLSLL